jgi:hypothetical protein
MAEKVRPYVTGTESFRLELLVGENGALPILLQFVIGFASSFESLFVTGFGGLVPSEELEGWNRDPAREEGRSNGRA